MTSRYMDWYQTAKKFEIDEIPYKNFSNDLFRLTERAFGLVYKTECKSIGLVTIKEIDHDEIRRIRRGYSYAAYAEEIKEIIKEVFKIKTCYVKMFQFFCHIVVKLNYNNKFS